MNLKDITVEMLEQIIDKNNIENKNIVVKDFINTIVINELFSIGLKTLLFKGGTSLYKQIGTELGRISEDIDLYISKEEYIANKKKIKSTIDNFKNYELFNRVEMIKSNSSNCKRSWNLDYSDDDHSAFAIGKVEIELVFIGGEDINFVDQKICSIIETSIKKQFIEPNSIKKQSLPAILIDKLFIVGINGLAKDDVRNTRDLFDIQTIFQKEPDINWTNEIESRKKRKSMPGYNTGELKTKEEVLAELEMYLDVYRRDRNKNDLFFVDNSYKKISEEIKKIKVAIDTFFNNYELI